MQRWYCPIHNDTLDILLLPLIRNFRRETASENKQFKETKHGYLLYTVSDNAIKGTIVNRALSSLNEGPLEITLTVPLSWEKKHKNTIKIILVNGVNKWNYVNRAGNFRMDNL